MRSRVKPDPEELRRRGLELQAQLPPPSARALAWAERRNDTSTGTEVARAVAEVSLLGWLLVLAVALWRRLRRFADSAADSAAAGDGDRPR